MCHVLIFRTAVMRRQIIPSIPIPVTCANRHGDLDDCTAGCGFAGGRHDVVSACCRRVVSDGGGPNLQLLFFHLILTSDCSFHVFGHFTCIKIDAKNTRQQCVHPY